MKFAFHKLTDQQQYMFIHFFKCFVVHIQNYFIFISNVYENCVSSINI